MAEAPFPIVSSHIRTGAGELPGFDADQREYSMCLPMLAHFGISKLRLMTTNPRKVAAMEKYGVEISVR